MEHTLLRHFIDATFLLLLSSFLPSFFLPRRLSSLSRFLLSLLFSLLFSLPLLFLYFPWPSFLHAIHSERHTFLYRHYTNETTVWKMHVVTSLPSSSLPTSGSILVNIRIPNLNHDSLAVCFYTFDDPKDPNDNFDVTKAIESGLSVSVCPVSDERISRFTDFAEMIAEKKKKKKAVEVIESDTAIVEAKVIHAKSLKRNGLAIAFQNRNWGDTATVSYRVTLSIHSHIQNNAQKYLSANLMSVYHMCSHTISQLVTPYVTSYFVNDVCYQNRNALPQLEIFLPSNTLGIHHLSLASFLNPVIHAMSAMYEKGHGVTLGILLLNLVLFVFFLHSPYNYSISARKFSLLRIVTSTFAHADVIHLISNMVAFTAYAPQLHTHLCCNNVTFLLCYAVSAASSAYLSVTLWPNAESIGASGAIYGIEAAVFAIRTSHNAEDLNSFITYIAFDTAWAMLTSRNINAIGHLGGAIGGYLFGAAYISIVRAC